MVYYKVSESLALDYRKLHGTEYNYNLYDGHGFGKLVERGVIIAKSKSELRAKAIQIMSKTKIQTMEVSTAKNPHYSETAIDIYNHYFGSIDPTRGEWWDKNGMHAFDKMTGKPLGKTGR